MSGDSLAVSAEASPARGLDWRLMLPVFIIVSLDAASSGAILPILPFYLRAMGASPLVLGLVLGAEALSQCAAAPFIGELSDRFGRKSVLLASQTGALLSLCLLAWAHNVFLVLMAKVLLGLTAANFAAAAAYAADNSTPATRRQAIGILSAGLGLGGIMGPSLSGYLSATSMTAPIWAAIALSAASITVTVIGLKGSHSSAQRESGAAERNQGKIPIWSILTSPVIRVIILVLLCHYFSYGMFSAQLAVFLGDTFLWNGHEFGPKELGYILTADGAINILVQLFLLKWLGGRFSEKYLIVMVFSILSVGYVTAGLATGVAMLAFAVLCVSTGVALARPTFVAALSVRVPQQRQGIVMGATQSLVAVTDIVTPVLAGLILGQSLYGAWIGVVVLIALAGAVIAGSRLPRIDPEKIAAGS